MSRAHVVFVHGLRTSATMWRNQLAPLTAHNVHAVAIDLPGHGARMAEPFTLDAAFAAIASGLAAAEPAVPRLLVGLSLGGYLALAFAARHPGAASGIVAASCSTVPAGWPLTSYRAVSQMIQRLPDRGRGLHHAMTRVFLPPEARTDVTAGGTGIDAMTPAIRAIGTLDLPHDIARIDEPVWFVNGRFDHFRLHERPLLQLARNGRRVIIPGATHLVSLCQPARFRHAVLSAVGELEHMRARSLVATRSTC